MARDASALAWIGILGVGALAVLAGRGGASAGELEVARREAIEAQEASACASSRARAAVAAWRDLMAHGGNARRR